MSQRLTTFGSGTGSISARPTTRPERLHQHDAGRHRARRDISPSSVARDTHATAGRMWRETARPRRPITGVNRFMRGDASRVTDKPASFEPDRVCSAGVLWRGTEDNVFTAGQPFLSYAIYGDPTGAQPNRLRRPRCGYAAADGRERSLRGRPLDNLLDDNIEFAIVQSYDFQKTTHTPPIPGLRGRARVHA